MPLPTEQNSPLNAAPGAPPDTVPVALHALIDLAADIWRLEKWLAAASTASPPASARPAAGSGPSLAAVRHVTRRAQNFLRRADVETIDLTGRPYEPGLALEVVEEVVESV